LGQLSFLFSFCADRQTSTLTNGQTPTKTIPIPPACNNKGVAYRGVVETSSAVETRECGAVDDLVLTVGACEARLTVAMIAAETDVATDRSVETWFMRCTVI